MLEITFAWSAFALATDTGEAVLVDSGTIAEQEAAVVLLVVREPLAAIDHHIKI
jgi:hypothetical protein